MILAEIMDEVATVLQEITGLRVFAWPPGSVVPPAGVVSYPESIDYDQAYQRGEDQVTDLGIVLVAGIVTARQTRQLISDWSAGAGSASVKQRMEAHRWVSCDDLTVTSCKIEPVSIAAVDYLAAFFTANVVGPGE